MSNLELKILIADDHFLIAKLLKMMLVTAGNNNVVELVKSGVEVFDFLKNRNVDLIMLDIDMPDMDGVQALRQIKSEYKDIKVIMISNHTESWMIKRCLKLGADGYISKYADSDEILHGINLIFQNQTFICNTCMKALCATGGETIDNEEEHRIRNSVHNLSKREIEIMKLVIEEYSSKEIGELLFISTRTVETHRKNILNKLGVKNSLGLIKLFVETDLIDSLNVS
ncbi:MAG: response regulator transcription factor [Candidatus Kapabacteria bacterium]|nr:response regulator transcription factor [Ignavibacteriota bacterium]MCW5885899.1 response regulator transcription factor [Candidatus Kapabacteria bacterium]